MSVGEVTREHRPRFKTFETRARRSPSPSDGRQAQAHDGLGASSLKRFTIQGDPTAPGIVRILVLERPLSGI